MAPVSSNRVYRAVKQNMLMRWSEESIRPSGIPDQPAECIRDGQSVWPATLWQRS